MKPSVERLNLSPMDAMALACATCYGRTALREPEREAKLVAGVFQFDPPHLSIGEHARWTFQAPLSFHLAETLLTLPKPPRYQAIAKSDGYGLFGFNLSQLRAFHATGHPFALQAIELVREQVAPAVADLPRFESFHPARLVPDDELSPEQARTFRVFQFRIRCSRACSHQLVRHRDLSFEQASQRQGKTFQPAFVWPPSFERLDQWWLGALEEEMLDVYTHLLDDGDVRAEDARYVLPNAMATTLIATADMAGWRHLLRLRGEPKAQHEIRYVARGIREEIAADDPALVDGLPVSLRGLDAWLPAEVTP